jgi:hypothetical protein
VAVGDGAVVGRSVPDAPADALAGAGEDFVLAVFDFVPELAGVGHSCLSSGEAILSIAAGFYGAEEVPAEARLRRVGEDHGYDAVGQGFGEEGGEAGTEAGGVDEGPIRIGLGGAPLGGEGEELVVEGGVFDAEPEAAVDGAVAGEVAGAGFDFDHRESCHISSGVR